MPLTVPPDTVATEVLLVLQPPPLGDELSSCVVPVHTDSEPLSAVGAGVTVATATLLQPAAVVYVIDTVPVASALSTPEPSIVAIDGLPLTQLPPDGRQPRVVVAL